MSDQNDPMMDESVAYQRGRNAYRAGYQGKDNPYWKSGSTRLAVAWHDGWTEQELTELSKKMERRS